MKAEENPKPVEAGYETTDADAISIALAGALVAICGALAALVCTAIFHFLNLQKPSPQDQKSPMAAETALHPGPLLQVTPEADLRALRRAEDTELGTYGWIDQRAGIVRIPIDRAMALLLQRGLPVVGQPGAPPATKTSLQLSQERPLQSTAPNISP